MNNSFFIFSIYFSLFSFLVFLPKASPYSLFG
jgi:hypothetical protein